MSYRHYVTRSGASQTGLRRGTFATTAEDAEHVKTEREATIRYLRRLGNFLREARFHRVATAETPVSEAFWDARKAGTRRPEAYRLKVPE